MLLVETPPAGPDWTHELKYDGYRIHARLMRGDVRLLTRTGLDWTDRHEATAKAISVLAAQTAYLVCEVRFLTWTADGLVRQGANEGLRADKSAKDVQRPGPG